MQDKLQDSSSNNAVYLSKKRKTSNAKGAAISVQKASYYTNKEARYKSFINSIPNLDTNVASSIITKAASIATRDCLLNQRAVLKVQRAQQQSSKLLFSKALLNLDATADSAASLALAVDNAALQS